MGIAHALGDKKNLWDGKAVVQEQAREFDARWTLAFRVSCLLRYPQSSSLRILFHALRGHGLGTQFSGKVLEYGFGHGHALFWFSQTADLSGIDISQSAITGAAEKARRAGYARAEFKKPPDDDPIRIDYPANSFDVVICSHTIEHVYDDGKLILELHRVLKPGGKCFLLVPQDVHERGVLDDSERRRPDFPEGTVHVWRYNLDSFVHLVRGAGLRDLEARSLDAFFRERDTLRRPLQIICSLAFAALPYGVWEWVDRRSSAKGYNPAQILVVATKD